MLLPEPAASPAPPTRTARACPAFVLDAIEGMRAVMAGGPSTCATSRSTTAGSTSSGVPCMRRPARSPPARPGATARSPARSAGPSGARDVGVALSRNRFPIIVPCHRVVAANGALTGFSAPGGLDTKRRMLELEGAPGYGQQVLFG